MCVYYGYLTCEKEVFASLLISCVLPQKESPTTTTDSSDILVHCDKMLLLFLDSSHRILQHKSMSSNAKSLSLTEASQEVPQPPSDSHICTEVRSTGNTKLLLISTCQIKVNLKVPQIV